MLTNFLLPQNKKKCCIFDFDSTLVSIETLDFLISKSNSGEKKSVENITTLAMSGKITFADSLRMRFSNINLTKKDIEKLKDEICAYITNGFEQGISELKNDFDLYIISGGFIEIIYPVAQRLGISKDHCFANNFIFQGNEIIDFDQKNILAQNGGKPKIVAKILTDKSYEKIFMIGDGYTDLEVAKADHRVIFCGFGAHVAREAVRAEAKYFFYNVESLVEFIVKK